MFDEAGCGCGAESEIGQVVSSGKALKEEVCERNDVALAISKGREGKPDGSQAESEFAKELAVAGKFSKGRFGGGDNGERAGSAEIEGFEDAKEQRLAGGAEKVDTIEEDEAGEGLWIGLREEPVARVVAGESPLANLRLAVSVSAIEEACKRVFAGAGFAFQRGDTQMWGDDAGLIEEPSNCWAGADELGFWSVEGFAVGGLIRQFRFI